MRNAVGPQLYTCQKLNVGLFCPCVLPTAIPTDQEKIMPTEHCFGSPFKPGALSPSSELPSDVQSCLVTSSITLLDVLISIITRARNTLYIYWNWSKTMLCECVTHTDTSIIFPFASVINDWQRHKDDTKVTWTYRVKNFIFGDSLSFCRGY